MYKPNTKNVFGTHAQPNITERLACCIRIAKYVIDD